MYKLGIDLGGTNIVAGIVDENFKIIATAKCKTNCPRPSEEIANDMAAVALEAIKNAGLKKEDIDSAGVGSPGAINPTDGVVVYSNNLGFFNFRLAKLLKDKTSIDFFIDNDANSAAYGEFIAGAGKGSKNFVMITLGTGVGGGVIIDGKMLTGSNYAGAELGHTVIDINGQMCNCGRQGCFEAYASATALIRQTKQAMTKYPESTMWDIVKGDINAVNGITAFDAMRQGDEPAKSVVEKYIHYLSVGVANNINIFQPEILCIGGGISKEGDNLIVPLQKIVCGENYARMMNIKTEIKAAELGNDAGIIGAAYLCNLYK